MSTSASNGFREGIWEIRDYEIIAHYPEGAWRLTALDVESIRLEPETDDGVPVCDAFLRVRSHPRSDLIGRYPQGEDQICVELALFAARNRIQLIGQPLPQKKTAPVTPGVMVTTAVAPRQRSDLPKSPDSAYETQADPNQPYGFNQGTDPNQPYGFNQGTDPNQPYGFNQGTDPNQSYGPGMGFNPNNPFEFRNPEWRRWTYDHANPAYRRNVVLTVLASIFIASLVGTLLIGGLRVGSFFSGPGFIILLIILSNRKKGKRRR